MKIESLTLKNMAFGYDGAAPLFEDVTFDLPCGGNTMVTGPSGMGKSALLKILAGLLSPKSGSYFINGQDVCQMSFEEFLPFRKRIGYGFDLGGLLANRTLWDNLMLPLQYHGELPLPEAEERVAYLMDHFQLLRFKDRRPASVSGASRKATVVARTFVMRPSMLIFDDPFVGMDRDTVRAFLGLLEEHRTKHGLEHVFFTSRGESASLELATQMIRVEHGKLTWEDRSDDARHAGGRKVANG
ncbi:MAG: ATP-binding cassette domain-containing protein [Bdellovibrionaceae bacterium]|nr:ATP-binding cassette domain-containing protein [Pseudobdellovibrionaceae bacterium]